MAYLNWDTKIITDFSPENIEKMYEDGYVFTRVDHGVMNKTRSFRVKLSDFEMSSENRRILRKVKHLKLEASLIPYRDYSWKISKLAKDFYKNRDAKFSANKIKKLLTDKKTNFNTLFTYKDTRNESIVGYVICYESFIILHYSFPFYVENSNEPSLGLGMMIQAINYTKEKDLKYIYLGSLQRPSDTYKLQFSGGEWFDGKSWQEDTDSLRFILKN